MPRDAKGGRTISTIGDLIDTGGGLNVYCANRPDCCRTLDCDIYDLAIWLGRRQTFVRTRLPLRCAKCGSKDVRATVTTETRVSHVANAGMPENFRRSRTEEERRALAMVFPRRLTKD